jgi:hypothetical protein
MTTRFQSIATIFLVVIVVMSTAALGSGAVSPVSDEGNALSPADEIHVKENGDAVLVYEGDADKVRKVRFGMNISKGLIHTLVVSNITESNKTNATGNITAILTGEMFNVSGNISMPRPESLSNQEFSVNMSGKHTKKAAKFDAFVDATISGTSTKAASFFVKQARMNGSFTMSASTLDATADAHVQLAQPLGHPMHHEVHIAEQDGTYTVQVSQKYVISGFSKQKWTTRAQAKRTLTRKYASVAKMLGGTADLTLESYSLTRQRGGYQLDIDYTITYRGIENGLVDKLTNRLTIAQKFDINQSQAQIIAQNLKKFTVKEVSVQVDKQRKTIDATMEVHLKNHDELVRAALNILESSDKINESGPMQKVRDRFKAWQASNLTQRYNISAKYIRKSPQGPITINAELHLTTDNWRKYVMMLEKRGVEFVGWTYEFHVATEGERVVADMAIEVTKDNLLKWSTNKLLNISDETEAARPHSIIKAFREADFQKAKMGVSLDNNTVRFEAGASFKNLTTLRDAIATTEAGKNIQSVVIRTEGDTASTYILVKDAVDPQDVTKDEIRDLSYVDDDTVIKMNNSAAESIPKMNVTQARSYLGLETANSGLLGLGLGNLGYVIAGGVVIIILAGAFVVIRQQ